MIGELLQKYIWLINTLVRAGEKGLLLNEITQKWEKRFDSPYSRRTFNNHREAIENVFGIEIKCKRHNNRYFIEYSDDVSDESAANAWLINTFTVNNMLNLGKERLSGRISVEDIPSGHKHLTSIMDAMTEGRELIIEYQKYTSSKAEKYTIQPYALKESSRRWYVVAYCLERDDLRVYGLDRICRISESGKTFRIRRDFDVEELFATGFGVYIPDGPAKTIAFKCKETDARYIRDLPLHASQVEIGRDGDDAIFNIHVCPNKALIMEFCKYGSRIEVISPESVRESVAAELKAAAEKY